jgi:hypothetical protein
MADGYSVHLWVCQQPVGGGVDLPNAPHDADAMYNIVSQRGIKAAPPDGDVTRGQLLQAIRDASTPLATNDLLVISFSGHGASLSDGTTRRTIWYCADGAYVVDDEVYAAIVTRDKIRVVIVEENCRSDAAARREVANILGLDVPDLDVRTSNEREARFVLPLPINLPSNGIVMASCSDKETSQTVSPDRVHALFTYALITVTQEGFAGSYRELICSATAIVRDQRNGQIPDLIPLGADGPALCDAPAFKS